MGGIPLPAMAATRAQAMSRDFEASFYLSVHDLHGGHTFSRPTDRWSG
jgi:hypothetical protein